MPVSNDYRDFVLEQLAAVGSVSSRAMFGGVGLYLDGLFFAIIDDDILYFKADDASRKRYEAAGSRPFCPDPSRPDQAMGYWQVPARSPRGPRRARRLGARVRGRRAGEAQQARRARRAPAARRGARR